ncbi:MAG TPA: OmpA family protein, partial [Kofleriaceae bacterium]|nr:OmpA family protein [Kofleriaceae bacterium]
RNARLAYQQSHGKCDLPPGPADRDHDGILDDVDKCPDQPEDKDGFEDPDGCPELDNDRDRIPDEGDACPLDPEDRDGFEDADGCPEPDNDVDLILDVDDACPRRDGETAKQTAENYNTVEDTDGCPDRDGPVVTTTTEIEVLKPIHFEFDSDVIKPISYPTLDAVADTMNLNPDVTHIEVQGHTDERGSDAYNLDLSQRRAASVVRYLIGKKVEAGRLTAQGYGEREPKIRKHTPEAWAVNRRVEFIILHRASDRP